MKLMAPNIQNWSEESRGWAIFNVKMSNLTLISVLEIRSFRRTMTGKSRFELTAFKVCQTNLH